MLFCSFVLPLNTGLFETSTIAKEFLLEFCKFVAVLGIAVSIDDIVVATAIVADADAAVVVVVVTIAGSVAEVATPKDAGAFAVAVAAVPSHVSIAIVILLFSLLPFSLSSVDSVALPTSTP